jgi:hypothetical protein
MERKERGVLLVLHFARLRSLSQQRVSKSKRRKESLELAGKVLH